MNTMTAPTYHSCAPPQHDPTAEWFVGRLSALTLTDLDRVAGAIEASMMSSADWLAWRRAVDAADRAVRRLGRVHEAGIAAHEAALAVITALDEQTCLPDARVTTVARAAREAAAALVAHDAEPQAAWLLLQPWHGVLAAPIAA